MLRAVIALAALVWWPLIAAAQSKEVVFLGFGGTHEKNFLASPQTTTLPVRIFTYIEQTFDPLVTGVCSLLVLLTAAAVVIIERSVGVGRLFGTEESTRA